MQPTFATESLNDYANLVVGVFEDGTLSHQAEALDKALGGYLTKSIARAEFEGKPRSTLMLTPASDWETILLVGLGKRDGFEALDAQKLGGVVARELNAARIKEAAVALGGNKLPLTGDILAANIAYGAKLRTYRFDKYRTKEEAKKKPTLTTLVVMHSEPKAAESAYDPLDHIADAVLLTRDLINEPANVIHPESFPEKCRELAKLGVNVKVLNEAEMKKLGMNALLAVGQGSAFESHLVVMEWMNGPKDQKPVAFVGKGVTFDTGGISIKPSGGMEDMKWDMGGAGVVTGVMRALSGRGAKVNAIGVIGLVENMPSGMAQRPGDVVTSMSGQTIEVLNTDAEGRLVLADALWYTQEKYTPACIVDLATLTGAILVALAGERAGLFSNDDTLAERLFETGEAMDERVWRFPLGKEYDEMINSDIADMKNIGDGRGAGSITAAQFLQRFVKDGTAWAHLDIAGVTWSKKDSDLYPKGGTAFGVRLLDQFVRNHYEES